MFIFSNCAMILLDMVKKVVNKKTIVSILVLLVLGVIAGMALVLFLATSVIPKALVTLTRASSSDKVVVSGSYLIGE